MDTMPMPPQESVPDCALSFINDATGSAADLAGAGRPFSIHCVIARHLAHKNAHSQARSADGSAASVRVSPDNGS